MSMRMSALENPPDKLEVVFIYYTARENSDLTEGKGSMREVSCWETEEQAYEACKGRGVMGVGDGEVWKHTLTKNPNEEGGLYSYYQVVYGYGKAWDGKWRSTWMDHRDAPSNDPEYAEYRRLKEKFETSQ